MKYKYLKCFLAIVLAMLLMTACAKNDYSYPPLDPALVERIDNETPKEELITKEYSLYELRIFTSYFSPNVSKEVVISNINNTDILDIEKMFPIECLRKVSDKFYYVVYKVKEGGYLYVHFEHSRYGAFLSETHAYYAADEQPNIKKIKKGDPFSTVAAYDKSIASADVNFFPIPNDNGDGYYGVTLHRQDNKLYMITYEDGSSIDAIKQSKVKSVKRIYDMTISPKAYKEYDYEYNYQILKIDQ